MLEGDLSDFSIPDILRLLAFTAKTGRLRVRDGERQGRVELASGRIVHASADDARVQVARRLLGSGLVDAGRLRAVLEHRTDLPTDTDLLRELVGAGVLTTDTAVDMRDAQVLDATFELLRLDRGTFRFDAGPAPGGDELGVGLDVDEVLDEASARLDAWPQVESRTGADTAVVTIRRPDADTEPLLDADGWALLALVDGRRTVAELTQLSGRGAFATRRILGELLEQGVITIGASGDQAPVQRLLDAHRALSGLESSRAGDAGRAAVPEPPPPAPPPTEPSPPPPPVTGGGQAGEHGHDDATSPSPAEPVATMSWDEPVAPTRSTEPAAPTRSDEPAAPTRSAALTTDPSIDEELVDRLIDGVEGL